MSLDQLCGVYIIASSDDKYLYIGMSTRLLDRIQSHKDKLVAGYAKSHNCTKLVYYELTDNHDQALAREKELKGWVRFKKDILIETVDPQRQDLFQKLTDAVNGLDPS